MHFATNYQEMKPVKLAQCHMVQFLGSVNHCHDLQPVLHDKDGPMLLEDDFFVSGTFWLLRGLEHLIIFGRKSNISQQLVSG